MLVSLYWTTKMTYGPINIRYILLLFLTYSWCNHGQFYLCKMFQNFDHPYLISTGVWIMKYAVIEDVKYSNLFSFFLRSTHRRRIAFTHVTNGVNNSNQQILNVQMQKVWQRSLTGLDTEYRSLNQIVKFVWPSVCDVTWTCLDAR